MINQRAKMGDIPPEPNASKPGKSNLHITSLSGKLTLYPDREDNLMTYSNKTQSESVVRALNLPTPSLAARSEIPIPTIEIDDALENLPQNKPKKHQSRAPFGKWRAKEMPGFPSSEASLPVQISATDICRLYPNHVDDYVIKDLMHQGMGAKAIDALIPAPPGKIKAGQSHSKIQLRITTIRLQFPNDYFPIPSTRRNRQQSSALQDETVFPKDESSSFHDANTIFAQDIFQSPSSKQAVSYHQPAQQHSVPNTRFRSQEPARLPSTHRSQILNTNIPRPSRLPSSQRTQSAFYEELIQAARPSITPVMATSIQLSQPFPSLEDQIGAEYEKHQRLVFEAFCSAKPLFYPLETIWLCRDKCYSRYDAESWEVQKKLGRRVSKIKPPIGHIEHPLRFLQRCSLMRLEENLQMRAEVVLDCPLNEVPNRLEAANNKNVLGLLKIMTKELKDTMDVNQLLKAYASLLKSNMRERSAASAQHTFPTSGLNSRIPTPNLNPGEILVSQIKPWGNHEAHALKAEQEQACKYPTTRQTSRFFSPPSASPNIDPQFDPFSFDSIFARVEDDVPPAAKRIRTDSGKQAVDHGSLRRVAAAGEFSRDDKDRKTSQSRQQGKK